MVASAASQSPPLRDHGFHLVEVRRVTQETGDAVSIVLEPPAEDRDRFAYEAGQFCTFRVTVDGTHQLRSYSMSSSPGVDGELQVTVKRVPGGIVSNWIIDNLAAGATVEVTRPAGVFCLSASLGHGDLVLFGGGSGITPLISLLKSALATTTRTVRLMYANKDRDSVIFAAELDRLVTASGGRLTVTHHLDIEDGFVDDASVRAFVATVSDADFFICGPGPFMDIVESSLLALHVGAQRVHLERFTPTPVEVRDDPVVEPTDGVRITIELDGRTDTADYHPGTTVLQTARQMGMSPPFSCESGSCATCMAKLVEGTVRMHVNNALTDAEVEEGWVLTCQSVPTSPVVRVKYGFED